MTDASMPPVVRHDGEICVGGGRAAPGVARWLDLTAAPTFAIMALWTFSVASRTCFHGDARLIADERNAADVSADERLPFIALVETDR